MKCKKYIKECTKLKKELMKYKKLATKDFLTGLWNERKLKQDLKRYTEIQKRSKVKFIVALFDVDNFKQCNDKYGHEYGNKVLKTIANVLKYSVRKYENVYRLGSGADEFVAIFSHGSKPLVIIKRIKKLLLKNKIKCSVGMDTLQKNILKIIDGKMYEDKRRKK